jgi:tetratricopeptide (TPR) repeat protein
MADIFISYASDDRPFARRLADALEARGWSVWWDRLVDGGDTFERVIEEAIRGARVVIVVWSKTAVESGWVRDEAMLALEERKLVPLRIDTAGLPMRFRSIHTIDLASWTGETDAEPFERLVRTLGRYLGPPMPSDRPRHPSIPAAPVGADEQPAETPSITGNSQASPSSDSSPASTVAIEPTSITGPPPRAGRKHVGKYLAAVAVTVGVVWGVGTLEQGTDGAAAKAAYDRGDYATALRWYRKAADQGNASAQANLGWMYENGQGISQDSAEALRWFRKAADQGDAWAQNNLGVLYRSGSRTSVPQDYAESLHWFRRAADQGYAIAQYNLGRLYEDGRGVPQDKVQARAWMQKAAAAGNDDAKKWLAKN